MALLGDGNLLPLKALGYCRTGYWADKLVSFEKLNTGLMFKISTYRNDGTTIIFAEPISLEQR